MSYRLESLKLVTQHGIESGKLHMRIPVDVLQEACNELARLRTALAVIANMRNQFSGPSLDYMQGYRDGQEFLAKIAREVIVVEEAGEA